jgi:hypothetical protein
LEELLGEPEGPFYQLKFIQNFVRRKHGSDPASGISLDSDPEKKAWNRIRIEKACSELGF